MVPATKRVLSRGLQRAGFSTDFSPWDEVVSLHLGQWGVTSETRIYVQSSFPDPCSRPSKLPETKGEMDLFMAVEGPGKPSGWGPLEMREGHERGVTARGGDREDSPGCERPGRTE